MDHHFSDRYQMEANPLYDNLGLPTSGPRLRSEIRDEREHITHERRDESQPRRRTPPFAERRTPRLELPKFDGGMDPHRFIQIFENACEVYGETSSESIVQLFSMALQGVVENGSLTLIEVNDSTGIL